MLNSWKLQGILFMTAVLLRKARECFEVGMNRRCVGTKWHDKLDGMRVYVPRWVCTRQNIGGEKNCQTLIQIFFFNNV